jgi:hypothetical protein
MSLRTLRPTTGSVGSVSVQEGANVRDGRVLR